MRRRLAGEREDGGSCGVDFCQSCNGYILGWVSMILLDDVTGDWAYQRDILGRGVWHLDLQGICWIMTRGLCCVWMEYVWILTPKFRL